uniref:Uncharacterized protein n=1 Tax=Arion vulgaris TaxID=1028688 RepID=A0A0B7B211_9EUPU
MRSHHDEHSDSLPVIDITALKHTAYVFDALIYYMRTAPDSDVEALRDGVSVTSWQDGEEGEEEHDEELPGASSSAGLNIESESMDGDSDSATRLGRRHPFFQRSDSTLFMGCPPPDPFHTPLVEALPLADQPHLLQPNGSREDYFGMAKPTVISKTDEGSAVSLGQQLPLSLALLMKPDDDRMQLAQNLRNAAFQPISAAPISGANITGRTGLVTGASVPGSSRMTPASSDLFPQSVAVNLSLSGSGSSISQEVSVNPLNIPLPMDPAPASVQTAMGPAIYSEPSSSVIVASSSAPHHFSTTFALPHPSTHMASSAPPTPGQLARAALSAFSEIATSRERLSTVVTTAVTTTISTPSMSSGSSLPSYQLHLQQALTSGPLSSSLPDATQTSVIVHTASTPPTQLVSSQLTTLLSSSATSHPSTSFATSVPSGPPSRSHEDIEDTQPSIRPKIHFAFLAWSQNQVASSAAASSASSQGTPTSTTHSPQPPPSSQYPTSVSTESQMDSSEPLHSAQTTGPTSVSLVMPTPASAHSLSVPPTPAAETASGLDSAPIDLVGANENVSNTVDIETSEQLAYSALHSASSAAIPPPPPSMSMSSVRHQGAMGQIVSHDMLLGRWRLSLDLFGRVFCDDVGAEPGSVISELGGFPVKEGRIRREMEKTEKFSTERSDIGG